jgi:NodT family efflux transporter outer membrane factor (OMF) lipoprotein
MLGIPLAVVACLWLVAGCNFAPTYEKPGVETPETFKEAWKTAEPSDANIRGKWWEAFHEPDLDALEAQAAISNQSVAVAAANFAAARAVVNQAQSQYFPTVMASPSAAKSRQPVQNSSGTLSSVTRTAYALPFDASWELDFWGRIRNTVKASTLEAQATHADLENVRLTIQAEVAADYFQVRMLDAQKEIADAAVLAYRESLKLTQIQSGTGVAADQDVAEAESQLNIALAQATDLGILRAQLEHAIATLIGKPASSFSMPAKPLAATAVTIPSGVPSQLLERRPDVAAAERRVAEANAQIGVARAAYFPTVMLGASSGLQSVGLGSLFSGPGLVWSVGAALAQTLFDGGKRKAVTAQAKANYEITVANYRQTVLTAFQEVEDNLATLSILERELRQQNAAVESSHRSVTLVTERYDSGLDNYLVVTAAQTILLTNKRTALNLNTQQMTASVQLIKALGGGWDASNLPSVKDIGR